MIPQIHVLHAERLSPERDRHTAGLVRDHDVCVHVDEKREGPLVPMIACIEHGLASGDEWFIVADDDVVPFEGWKDQIDQIQETAPSPVVVLTHFGRYGQVLAARGMSYGLGPTLVWGCVVMYHRDEAEKILKFLKWAKAVGWNPMWGDGTVIAYLIAHHMYAAMTAVALFDHLPMDSSLGHSRRDNCFPRHTLLNDPAPSWSLGGAPVSRAATPEQKELARLWTEDRMGAFIYENIVR